MRVWLPRSLTLLLILYFWGIGLHHLDRSPRIYEDEAWIVSPGYTFWSEGRFGSDVFAGFHGMEQHYYAFMPLYSLVAGGGLHLFGMGLFQARVVVLFLGILILALTYHLGRRLLSPWQGFLAVLILTCWRLATPLPHHHSGIPLADITRIARYDLLVVVFGLAALSLTPTPPPAMEGGVLKSLPCLRGRDLGKGLPFTPFLIGISCGLATLSHIYGGFWLLACLVLLLKKYRRYALRPLLWVSLGFGLTLLPWVVFITQDWEDFQNQNRPFNDRIQLNEPAFYRESLTKELDRYRPIGDGVAAGYAGARVWSVLGVLSLLYLGIRAIKQRDTPAQTLLITLAIGAGGFALLINYKTYSYLATLLPLYALIIAAGGGAVWRIQRWWLIWQGLLLICLLTPMIEGLQRQADIAHEDLTSYRDFTTQIAAQLPPHSRVLAMEHYWLGLAEQTEAYQTFLVPIFWTQPHYVTTPRPFAQTAEAFAPDVVLIDEVMLHFLRQAADPASPSHDLYVQISAYLNQRHAQLIAEFYDPTYGTMRIFQLTP